MCFNSRPSNIEREDKKYHSIHVRYCEFRGKAKNAREKEKKRTTQANDVGLCTQYFHRKPQQKQTRRETESERRREKQPT